MENSIFKIAATEFHSDIYADSMVIISNFVIAKTKLSDWPKLAIFDLDDTLVIPKSGETFPIDADDWKFTSPFVPVTIQRLYKEGYLIYIITNQMGIFKKMVGIDTFKKRIEGIITEINVPIVVLAATRADEYRKPCIAAYEYLVHEILLGEFKPAMSLINSEAEIHRLFVNEKSLESEKKFKGDRNLKDSKQLLANNLSFQINLSKNTDFALGAPISRYSFYCGDAAGRKYLSSADFSNSDLLFALNIRLNFCVPEQIFDGHGLFKLSQTSSFQMSDLAIKCPIEFKKVFIEYPLIQNNKQTVVILLAGPPSCGKSHFTQQFFSDFRIISYVW
jgi:DNA 3'-phosphatase